MDLFAFRRSPAGDAAGINMSAPSLSRSASSSSSGIVVNIAEQDHQTGRSTGENSFQLIPPARRIVAQVKDGSILVVSAKDQGGRDALNQILQKAPSSTKNEQNRTDDLKADIKTEYEDDSQGPNHRGTYSKAYTLQHPEINWVHRGQGRYKPIPAAQATSISQSQAG
jgi:hypothetical protein